MRNITMLVIIGIVVLIVGALVYANSGSTSSSENSVDSVAKAQNGNAQKITLSMKNYNYYPSTIKVKGGVPVEITLDSSIGGCYRSFNINDFGVHAYSSSPAQKITFTPTKKGTFRFACSMGMGTGTIIVE